MMSLPPESGLKRTLWLINPRSPLSVISMSAMIRHMTFSRRAVFMPLNLAIHRGILYYYGKRGRIPPRFSDDLEADASRRIARGLGLAQGADASCPN